MDQELRAVGALVGPSEEEKDVILPASEGHVIRDLYAFCQDTVGAIFSTLNNEDILTRKWQELRGRLNTWEDGFSVVEGELDQVFVKTRDQHLREATCIILCSLARSLSIYMNSIDPKWSSEGALSGVAEVVVALAPTAKDFLEVVYDNSDGEVEDLIQDINDSVESLYDLVPSTERLFLSHHDRPQQVLGQRPPGVKSDTPESKLEVGAGVSIYRANIQDKFPKICDDLAMDLAKVNWNRHVRIRNMKPPEPCSPINRALIKPSTIGKDSGVGSSVQTRGASAPSNEQTSDTKSEISKASSTIPQTTTGMASFPRPPVEKLSSEIHFSCTICFKQLKGIRSKRMWEEHVLRDLQPYSCLFSNCSERNTTFYSNRLWVAHEFQHHRPQRVTMFLCRKPCKQKFRERRDMVHHIINGHLDGSVSESDVVELVDLLEVKVVPKKTMCPFCLDEIEETKASIQRHIGTHLVEIALKALPPDIDESSDFYDGSADSRNADIFGEEGDTRPGIYNLNPPTSTAYGGPVRCPVEGCQHSTTQFPSELDYRRHALGHRNDKITCPFPHPDLALQPAFPDLASFMTHLKKEGPHGHHEAGLLSSCEFCYDGTLFLPQGLYNHLKDCDFSYNSGELRTPELVNQSSISSNTPARLLLPQLYALNKGEDDVYVTANHIESWMGFSHAGDEVSSLHRETSRAEIKEESEKKTPLPLQPTLRLRRKLSESTTSSARQRILEEQVLYDHMLPNAEAKGKDPNPSYARRKSPVPNLLSQNDFFTEPPDIYNEPVLPHMGHPANKASPHHSIKDYTNTPYSSFWDLTEPSEEAMVLPYQTQAPQDLLLQPLSGTDSGLPEVTSDRYLPLSPQAGSYPRRRKRFLSHKEKYGPTNVNSAHQNSPNKGERFPCHCGKCFTRRSDLLRHQKTAAIHSPSQKFRCDVCGVSFNRMDNFIFHQARRHTEGNKMEQTKPLPTTPTGTPSGYTLSVLSSYLCGPCPTVSSSDSIGKDDNLFLTPDALACHQEANHRNNPSDCLIPPCGPELERVGDQGLNRTDNPYLHELNQQEIAVIGRPPDSDGDLRVV